MHHRALRPSIISMTEMQHSGELLDLKIPGVKMPAQRPATEPYLPTGGLAERVFDGFGQPYRRDEFRSKRLQAKPQPRPGGTDA